MSMQKGAPILHQCHSSLRRRSRDSTIWLGKRVSHSHFHTWIRRRLFRRRPSLLQPLSQVVRPFANYSPSPSHGVSAEEIQSAQAYCSDLLRYSRYPSKLLYLSSNTYRSSFQKIRLPLPHPSSLHPLFRPSRVLRPPRPQHRNRPHKRNCLFPSYRRTPSPILARQRRCGV